MRWWGVVASTRWAVLCATLGQQFSSDVMAFNDSELNVDRGPVVHEMRDESYMSGDALGPTQRRPRVLLVEDEQPFRELLQAYLEAQGYEVHAVWDGRCGVRWLEANRVDVVVTDLCMPEVDGMELLMTMRKSHAHTPVVVMSGGVGGETVGMLRAAQLLGAYRTLQKPFSLHQLANAVLDSLSPA